MQTLTQLRAAAAFLVFLPMTCAMGAQALIETTPPDLSIPLSQARHLLATNNYASAEHSLRETLAYAPNSAQAHYLLGFTLLHEQKPADAVAEYMEGAKLKEPGAEEFLGVAAAQTILNENENAERSLAAAAKLAPERPLTWYLLGRAQFAQGHWVDAEHTFATCLKLDPKHVQAQTSLGLVDEKLQRPDPAIAAFRAAIALQEDLADKDPQPYLALGMLLRKQGKVAEAVPLLVMATGSTTLNALAHQELALAYEQLHHYDEALGEMKTASFLAPNSEALHFFLGRIYRETGHQGESVQEFAQAAHLSAKSQ